MSTKVTSVIIKINVLNRTLQFTDKITAPSTIDNEGMVYIVMCGMMSLVFITPLSIMNTIVYICTPKLNTLPIVNIYIYSIYTKECTI